MPEFIGQDLSGARFEDVDLAGARFANVALAGVVIRGAWVDMTIDGAIDGLVVNGVDVVPMIEAELDRRHPDRVLMRPETADGYRSAFAVLSRLWEGTVDRARRLPPPLLHERVDGEWSFIETLRHLVFVTDAWGLRAYLGERSPWHPLGLPHDEMPDEPGVPRDRDARPSLDEVLAARADRMARMRQIFAALTDEDLAATTDPVPPPGYPPPESFPVRRCLRAVISEEWEHRLYAERDLDVLTARAS
nr:DinB family protein [uncultured Actinoplanes sp.]